MLAVSSDSEFGFRHVVRVLVVSVAVRLRIAVEVAAPDRGAFFENRLFLLDEGKGFGELDGVFGLEQCGNVFE